MKILAYMHTVNFENKSVAPEDGGLLVQMSQAEWDHVQRAQSPVILRLAERLRTIRDLLNDADLPAKLESI